MAHRRPDVHRHRRLGLDSRHPRPRQRHLAGGRRLQATGPVRLLDPACHHAACRCRASMRRQLQILGAAWTIARRQRARVALEASFEGVSIVKQRAAAARSVGAALEPREFPQLSVHQPRLWWPNGYGAAELYHAQARASRATIASPTTRQLRFGIRELTYELSLFDHSRPAAARRGRSDRWQRSRRAAGRCAARSDQALANGWAESLTAGGRALARRARRANASLTPYLVIRVNGVPIAARGGSWGMDDSRKRSSRARLEPYFRLHRAAHLNIIRNWLGQNTEEVFYDLADEYGLLVLNDFWESTQDFQVEAQDPALFLANARDAIRRYRNHPSIAVWFGRNEGVPQPIINEGLADLVATARRHALLHRQLQSHEPAGQRPLQLPAAGRLFHRPGAGFLGRGRHAVPVDAGVAARPRFRRPIAGRSSDTYRLSRLAFRRQRRCRHVHAGARRPIRRRRRASRTSSARRS